MPWSKWYRFSELKANPAKNCKKGVYQVRACTEDRTPVRIRRACCDDPKGIVYIGCGNLQNRVGLYVRTFNGKPKSRIQFHWVYGMFDLDRIGDPKFLEIRWMECDNCDKEERRLLKKYKKQTGDLPPGNLRLDGAFEADSTGPQAA